jgi:hypothetical protein
VNGKLEKFNSLVYRMRCETFIQHNGTHNNTIAHFSFENKNVYGEQGKYFDSSFAKTNLTMKRTDSNDQYFNLTMSEDMDYLQVQSHTVYLFDENTDKIPEGRKVSHKDEFEDFLSHPATSSILKTG